jgi:hypothetical protein
MRNFMTIKVSENNVINNQSEVKIIKSQDDTPPRPTPEELGIK